jgi:methionyl aminopeptidase
LSENVNEKDSMDEILNKYREAGRILSSVVNDAVKLVKTGEKLLAVALFVEEEVKKRGAEPAFPCNLSLNDEAAHRTPFAGEETVFTDEVVKLDAGAHIDGYVADMAVTIDLSGRYEDLKKSAEDALNEVIKIVRAGITTKEIASVIDETISGYGYKPVSDLTGHGLEQYNAHSDPSIPSKHIKDGVTLEYGQVIAVEPFATDGIGKTKKSSFVEIYQLIRPRPVRLESMRQLMNEIERYKTLPFAKRWLNSPSDVLINKLVNEDIIHPFNLLKEKSGGLVSQAEHTLIVLDDGCEVTTKAIL